MLIHRKEQTYIAWVFLLMCICFLTQRTILCEINFLIYVFHSIHLHYFMTDTKTIPTNTVTSKTNKNISMQVIIFINLSISCTYPVIRYTPVTINPKNTVSPRKNPSFSCHVKSSPKTNSVPADIATYIKKYPRHSFTMLSLHFSQ